MSTELETAQRRGTIVVSRDLNAWYLLLLVTLFDFYIFSVTEFQAECDQVLEMIVKQKTGDKFYTKWTGNNANAD